MSKLVYWLGAGWSPTCRKRAPLPFPPADAPPTPVFPVYHLVGELTTRRAALSYPQVDKYYFFVSSSLYFVNLL